MAITIDNSNYINNDYDRHGVPSGQTESVRDSGSRYVSSGGGLAPGQTVTGEIIERDGENVTVRFGQNQTISAKLQGNADIEVGMKLTFEVAKGANNQIALRPLYSNLANNNAAMSALRAAGLPINDTTLAMTDKMMTESMPVNRNALAEMFRNVSAHQNVSPESIVQMTKLNMPLTESNVIQFDNYRNFMHQITNDLQNVSEGVADLFREAVSATQEAQGNVPQQFGNLSAAEVINEVLDLIDTESLDAIKMPQSVTGDATGASQPVAADASPDAAVTADAKSETDPASNVTQSVQSDTQNAVLHEAVTVTEDAASTVKNTFEGLLSGIREMFTPDAPDTNTAVNTNLSLTPAEQVTLSGDVQELLILAGESSDIHEPLDPSEIIKSVKELLEEYPPDNTKVIESELPAYSEQSAESTSDAALNNAAQTDIDSLKNIADNFSANGAEVAVNSAADDAKTENAAQTAKAKIQEKLNEVLRSEGFTKLVKDSVKAQMSIRPEQVEQKEKIDELYEKIQKTTARINEMMESIGRADSSVAKSATALNDNVSFMNQLNEFVNYVQLPLKMAGEDANGELYVYTNKKNLQNNDGNYSALLHLDMEHLGPMDIYVTMRDHTRVNTNFYLQTEELLDFIEGHIDELTKRLTDKGYNTSTKVTKREPGEAIRPITDEFTKDEANADMPVVVSKMRFDVRA